MNHRIARAYGEAFREEINPGVQAYDQTDFYGREGSVLHFLHIDGREFTGFVKGTAPQAMEIETSSGSVLRIAYADIIPSSVVWDVPQNTRVAHYTNKN